MKLQITASLADSWFSPKRDGSGTIRFEVPATEFPAVIQMARFMDCYTKGGKTFTLTVEDGQ
jgi:hypothetical protein